MALPPQLIEALMARGEPFVPPEPDPLSEGDTLRVLGSEAPLMSPEDALAMNPPQEPRPNDFFSRLAMSGMRFGRPDRITSRTGGGGLAALLGLLGAAANYKAGVAGSRINEVDERNARAREAASLLAKRKHEMRIKSQRAAENKAAFQYKQEQDVLNRDERAQRQADLNESRAANQALRGETIELNRRLGGLGIGGQMVAKPRIATAAELDQLTMDGSMLSQINRLKQQYNPSFVGPVEGRTTTAGMAAGFAPKGAATFRQSLNGIRNHILKLRSGGAVTEPEAERLNKELPKENDPDQTFTEKMAQFEQTYREIAENRRANLAATGVALSRVKPLPGSVDWSGVSAPTSPAGAGSDPKVEEVWQKVLENRKKKAN